MQATEQLMKEHQLILKYVELMRRCAAHADDSLLIHANTFIGFIREFADHFHHAKEEDILFRYLVEPGVLAHCNPIPQMLFEHNKARELVAVMEKARAEENASLLATALNQYAQLITEHIFKEDNILYPMAERGLSDSAKTNLLADYAEAEQRLESTVIWQKYQSLYHDLIDRLN